MNRSLVFRVALIILLLSALGAAAKKSRPAAASYTGKAFQRQGCNHG